MKDKVTKMIALVGLANEIAKGEPIRISYGSYPYGEVEVTVNGQKRKVFVNQAFTRASAESVSAALANELARGGKGIPLYFGHPDVPALAVKYPDKRAYGWITAALVTDAGIELTPMWNEEPGDHFSHFSPYWDFSNKTLSGNTVTATVKGIKSIGCVNNPNIHEFRLPNEEPENETQTEEGNIMDIAKLAKLLGLAEEGITEDAITAEITRLTSAAADAQTRADAAEADAKEKDEAFANERRARISSTLDHALANGQITPAGRKAWDKRLTDDFDGGLTALANEKAMKVKEVGKPKLSDGGAAEQSVAQQITALANELIEKTPGMTFDAAYAKVKTQRPELFTK